MNGFAQQNPRPKNLVYGEAGGNAFIYSVNYQRIFWDTVSFASPCLRAGAGILPLKTGTDYEFPFEASLLIGKKRHFFELGAGFTVFSVINFYHGSPGGDPARYYRSNGANANGRIGYCFIPLRKQNFMFRVAFTPIFHPDEFYETEMFSHFIPMGGLSLGYAF